MHKNILHHNSQKKDQDIRTYFNRTDSSQEVLIQIDNYH